MTVINKDWKVYQLDLISGIPTEIRPVAESYEYELEVCNRLNRDSYVYNAVYYVDKNISKLDDLHKNLQS